MAGKREEKIIIQAKKINIKYIQTRVYRRKKNIGYDRRNKRSRCDMLETITAFEVYYIIIYNIPRYINVHTNSICQR